MLDLRRPDRLEKLRVEEKSPALDQGLSPPQLEIDQLRAALALQQKQIEAFLGPQHHQPQLAGPQHQLLNPQPAGLRGSHQPAGLLGPQQQTLNPQPAGLRGLPQHQQQQQLTALLNSSKTQPQRGFNSQNQVRPQPQQRPNRQQTLNFQRFQKNKKKNSRLSVFSQSKGLEGGKKVKKSTAKLQRDEFSRQRALALLNLH